MNLKEQITKTRYGWTLLAFIWTSLLTTGLIIWQLYEMRPRLYCALAEATSTETSNACAQILLKVIEVKDHNLIGLMMILGITVVSVLAVALGLNIKASGPGNTSVTVDADTTEVKTDDAQVVIPTPPSGE